MDISALLPGDPVWGQSYQKLFKITQVVNIMYRWISSENRALLRVDQSSNRYKNTMRCEKA